MKKKLLSMLLVFGFALAPLAQADIVGSGVNKNSESDTSTEQSWFETLLKDIVGSGEPSDEGGEENTGG